MRLQRNLLTEPYFCCFSSRFNQALQTGIEHIPELIQIIPAIPQFDLDAYFRHNISYELDDAKWQGLNLFLEHIAGVKGYHLHRNVATATF